MQTLNLTFEIFHSAGGSSDRDKEMPRTEILFMEAFQIKNYEGSDLDPTPLYQCQWVVGTKI